MYISISLLIILQALIYRLSAYEVPQTPADDGHDADDDDDDDLEYDIDSEGNCICPPDAPPPPPSPPPSPRSPGKPRRVITEVTCDVGEIYDYQARAKRTPLPPDTTPAGGACNRPDGDLACDKFCMSLYDEFMDSECISRGARKECVCKLKCCNQGCWGDPHCWACDGAKFSYQGLKEHWLLVPCQPYVGLPNFEVRQTNKLWHRGPLAVFDRSKIVIPEWQVVIEMIAPDTMDKCYIVKFNNVIQNVPFHWGYLENDHKRNSIDITYLDVAKKTIQLTTSFGLRVTINTHLNGKTALSDVSIDTPRHPELKAKMCGLVGRFNDNKNKNQRTDYNGKLQKIDNRFSEPYGKTFICNKDDVHGVSDADQEKEFQDKFNKVDPAVLEKISKTCEVNLRKLEKDCKKRGMGPPIPTLDECIMDALAIEADQDKHRYISALIKRQYELCHQPARVLRAPVVKKRLFGKQRAMINARLHGNPKTCNVGEPDSEAVGKCNQADGDAKCHTYCKSKFGADFFDSECSTRNGLKKECVCKTRCCHAGCAGDPHCYTCDGTKFGYQGQYKHVLLKPCRKYSGFPNFEIYQKNQAWNNGPLAILDTLELVIPEYNTTLELKAPTLLTSEFFLKINKKKQDIPYYSSKNYGFKELFVDVFFLDTENTQLVILTSFGLKVTVSGYISGNTIYTDVAINFPRHPALKGNICGLLGQWNGDPRDDGTDFFGKLQQLDEFSCEYGNSWIHPSEPASRTCTSSEKQKLESEHKFAVDKVDNGTKDEMRKLCQLNLLAIESCAKSSGRTPITIDNCITDLIYIDDVEDRKSYVRAITETYSALCGKRIPFMIPECHMKSKVPLYRLHSLKTDSYLFTSKIDAVVAMTDPSSSNAHRLEGSPGLVSTSPSECGCMLKPIYELYGKRSNEKADRFYTNDPIEAQNYIKDKKYTLEGMPFYCSSNYGKCGATVALRRYFLNGGHVYTIDQAEAKSKILSRGGKAEGILCYIWPTIQTGSNDDAAPPNMNPSKWADSDPHPTGPHAKPPKGTPPAPDAPTDAGDEENPNPHPPVATEGSDGANANESPDGPKVGGEGEVAEEPATDEGDHKPAKGPGKPKPGKGAKTPPTEEGEAPVDDHANPKGPDATGKPPKGPAKPPKGPADKLPKPAEEGEADGEEHGKQPPKDPKGKSPPKEAAAGSKVAKPPNGTADTGASQKSPKGPPTGKDAGAAKAKPEKGSEGAPPHPETTGNNDAKQKPGPNAKIPPANGKPPAGTDGEPEAPGKAPEKPERKEAEEIKSEDSSED